MNLILSSDLGWTLSLCLTPILKQNADEDFPLQVWAIVSLLLLVVEVEVLVIVEVVKVFVVLVVVVAIMVVYGPPPGTPGNNTYGCLRTVYHTTLTLVVVA